MKQAGSYFVRGRALPRFLGCWVLLMALILALPAPWAHGGEAQMDNAIDPSGGWKNANGSLSLMLTGDALSFSHSSVFGVAVHICDGAGVAGLVGNGMYHYMDDEGVIAFIITENEVRMETVSGVPSFCGANWPGDVYGREGYEPLTRYRVIVPKSRFYVVMFSPPSERKAYVIKGDEVEVIPTRHEQSEDYVLARFKGPKSTTVGLLRKDTLTPVK